MTTPTALSLAEIGRAFDERRLSARELIEAAIANHSRCDAKLHAYSLWTPDIARAMAQCADDAFADGSRLGPLHGIPVAPKDLFAVSSMPTFAGSPQRLPARWEQDGPVIAALRRQDSVFVGKTHMVEFAFGGTGVNAHWPCPRNPWDSTQQRSPGGSSSGAGVALLEGSALIALGTDTAGSVRIPASATGTVGLKVTAGRWSTDGIVPLSHTLDTPGVLARSAADAAIAFQAIDPNNVRPIAPASLAGLRIGIDDAMWRDCAPGIAETAKAALDRLAKAGANLMPRPVPEFAGAYQVFCDGGVSAIELRRFLDRELPDWIATLDPINAPVIARAATIPDERYRDRLARLAALAGSVTATLAEIDVVAAPTLTVTPPLLSTIRDTATHWDANRALTRNTVPVNYLGLCAISLPIGFDAARMPIGLQLIGWPRHEEALLAVALAAERVLGTAHDILGVPPLLA
ncbi:MAG: amidase [Alphaproteobacteria bacterium]|nr:amidase [Alphaproteobacteria bacterium]